MGRGGGGPWRWTGRGKGEGGRGEGGSGAERYDLQVVVVVVIMNTTHRVLPTYLLCASPGGSGYHECHLRRSEKCYQVSLLPSTSYLLSNEVGVHPPTRTGSRRLAGWPHVPD